MVKFKFTDCQRGTYFYVSADCAVYTTYNGLIYIDHYTLWKFKDNKVARKCVDQIVHKAMTMDHGIIDVDEIMQSFKQLDIKQRMQPDNNEDF